MKSTWEIKKPFGPFFKIFIIVFLILVATVVGIAIWYNSALGAPSSSSEKKTFIINKGETTISFTKRLYEEGFIKNQIAFRTYIKISGIDKEIQAGRFEIAMNLRGEALATLLTQGRFDKWVTIVEGLRKEQIADQLNEELDLDEKEFLSKAREGYLFPDTYLVPIDPTVDQILSIFQKSYEKNVTEEILSSAKKNGINEKNLIIFASIVEREAVADSQRPTIAGILIKRWKSGTALGADATVQYALGYSKEEETWWRKTLTADDLEIDSKYNSRKFVGLPPGPISNPGASSITAVAFPKDSPYLFYLHDSDGKAHYAKDLEEHEQNIAKYLN